MGTILASKGSGSSKQHQSPSVEKLDGDSHLRHMQLMVSQVVKAPQLLISKPYPDQCHLWVLEFWDVWHFILLGLWPGNIAATYKKRVDQKKVVLACFSSKMLKVGKTTCGLLVQWRTSKIHAKWVCRTVTRLDIYILLAMKGWGQRKKGPVWACCNCPCQHATLLPWAEIVSTT